MHTRIKTSRSLVRLTVLCTVVFTMSFPTDIPAHTRVNADKSGNTSQTLPNSSQQTGVGASNEQPSVSPAPPIGTLSEQERLPGLRVSTPIMHVCTPNTLVVLSTEDRAEMEMIISALESLDGCALHIFPPGAFIGFVPPLGPAQYVEASLGGCNLSPR